MRQVTRTPGATSCVSARMSWKGQAGSISADAHRAVDDPLERMEHHEARPVGDEIGQRLARRLEDEPAVGPALDARRIAERLRRVPAERVVGDREAFIRLAHLQVSDLGDVGSPVAVADEKGDAAQRLDAAKADVAQVAAVEHRLERAGAERAELARRLLGAVELDGSRRVHGCASPSAVAAAAVRFETTVPVSGSISTTRVMSTRRSTVSPGRSTPCAGSSTEVSTSSIRNWA
jgi:hypothetical protein